MLERTRRSAKEALLRFRPGLFWWYVRARHGFLEPEMALLPRLCLPDQASVDVGANYGVYSYYMLQYSRQCHAFEPYPHLAEILRQGFGSRLHVHQVALSDHSGLANLRVSPAETGWSTIEPSNRIEGKVRNPSRIETLQVPIRRLDEFDIGPIGFIKIDVEGHQEEVLAGATKTLESHCPALLIELEERHRSGSRERVLHQLTELGYHAFFLHAKRLRPTEQFNPERYQNVAHPADYISNFVLLPRHRLESFRREID